MIHNALDYLWPPIFVSYCREDAELVCRIRSHLGVPRLRQWIDAGRIEPGSIWQDQIRAGVRSSMAVVPVLTGSSLASKWVRFEVNYALLMNKPILAIRVGNPVIPRDLSIIKQLQ